jgi:D-sedoheptulose 7-phosphate isomerase
MTGAALADLVAERARARADAGREFFAREEERLAFVCGEMAERFERGGRLLALAAEPAWRSDAAHVAVEFVHPVIVGKRALPALVLGNAGAPLAAETTILAGPKDIAMGFGSDGDAEVGDALVAARGAGALTVGFGGIASSWDFDAADTGPFVRQEILETAYHVLWELVHVFLDHTSAVAGGSGDASFLYPFLEGGDRPAGRSAELLADVRASIRAKATEIEHLRERTLLDQRDVLAAAAADIAAALDTGGRVLAFGNGGSATDAADFASDLRHPPAGTALAPRPAIDLAAEPAVITAIANDVGAEAVFRRQVEAHGRAGDVAVAISTSGDSPNLVAALERARAGGLGTVAFVGGSGGRIVAEQLADHVVHVRSDYVPRIQEAQASALHVLRELVDR